ncbi:MAG TPA: NrsF family protein [Acidobacteriota bacterium]|nr:NrsF family protein [Acidobacteriota bacterium]
MSASHSDVPDRLRQVIGDSIEPVTPLRPPWKRLLAVLPLVLAAMAMPFAYNQLRDTGELGMMLAWVPVAIQVLLAFALLVFALREGIPGWRASSTKIFASVLTAYVLQIVVNLLIFARAPMSSGGTVTMWMTCFRAESLIGLPALVLIAWLVARTLPQRPLVAGFLTGTGAGFAAEASWRMLCPYSDAAHVLMGHTGGILVLGLTGFLLGYLWNLYAQETIAA